MCSNQMIIAKKPTIKIKTEEMFLYSMMRFIDTIDLNSIIALYAAVHKNMKNVLDTNTFNYQNTVVTYQYKKETLFLKNIEQCFPNDNELHIKCSEHFVAKLIRNKTSMLSLLPAYFYALKEKRANSEIDLLRKELSTGDETIVFSLKDNTLELVTGWTGNRKKRIFDAI